MTTIRPTFSTVGRLAAALFGLLVVVSPPPAGANAPAPGCLLPEAPPTDAEAGPFEPPRAGLQRVGTSQTEWRIPIVMVSFTDLPLTYTPAEFELQLFDTTHATLTGSFSEYWTWASGGRLRVTGRVVATVALPGDLYYYGYNYWGRRLTTTPHNIYGAVRDALMACEASVDWSEFDVDQDSYVDMLWLLHAGPGGEALRDYNSLWSITSRFTEGWKYGTPFETSTLVPGSQTQHMRIDRFTTVPEISTLLPGRRAEIGIFCHEFGHALGLPDLYDTSSLVGPQPYRARPAEAQASGGNLGPGYWSLMSWGQMGPSGLTPERPAHPGAWCLSRLGWIDVIRPATDTTITLAPVEAGGPAIEASFEGDYWPEHFLIENRQRLGFDQHLFAEGLLIYHLDDVVIDAGYATNHINTGPIPGLRLVEADGRGDLQLGPEEGGDRGGASDPFPGSMDVTSLTEETWPNTASFRGAPTGLALRDISMVGDDVQFTLQVRAPGWQPPRDRTRVGYAPIEVYSPARAAAVDATGTISVVRTESQGGLPQVVLRMRRGGIWDEGEVVSASPTSALGPGLALLPGGDLAVAWSDTRSGYSRIMYRARLGGRWTDEYTLAQLAGDAHRPALAADAKGVVYATWLQQQGLRLSIKFMRFAYHSPFGTIRTLTDSTHVPDDASITVSPAGRAYIMWANRASNPRKLWYASFSQDSGLSAARPLVSYTTYPPGAFSAVADSINRLHLVWFEGDGSVTRIHYQLRHPGNPSWLPDTVIEVREEVLLSPVLELGGRGTLHLVYEAASGTTQQVRYKRWREGWGWDLRSTAVTELESGVAYRPWVLPRSAGLLTVVYTNYIEEGPRFMERERTLDLPPVLAVPEVSAPEIAVARLSAVPDPVRSGAALALRWSGPLTGAPPEVEVFDVAGRRLASAPFLPGAAGPEARIDPARTATWPAGLYFARAKGTRATTRVVVLP